MKKLFFALLLILSMSSQFANATNNCLSFNGSNYVSLGNFGAVNSWTIECWFNTSSITDYRNLLHTNYPLTGASNAGVRVEQSASGSTLAIGIGGALGGFAVLYVLPNGSAIANQWHHLAIVGDKTNNVAYAYVDGVLKATTACSDWPATFDNFNIGRGYGATREFVGTLDKVNVWNYALSSTEINVNMNKTIIGTESGLISSYNFDQTSGTVLSDIKGAHNGTLVSSPTWQSNGNALDFDGVNDYVTIPDNNSLDVTQTTIETWVKWNPAAATDIQFICAKATEQMEIHTGAVANRLRFIPTNLVYLDVPNCLPVNQWTHIACVYNPSASFAAIYINGVLTPFTNNGPNPLSTAIGNSTSPFYIGQRFGGSFPFKGDIDEFKVWNTVRTQAQIQVDMAAEATGKESGLAAYYNFNQGFGSADNTVLTTLYDRTSNANNGTLTNFAKTGATSNFVASTNYIRTFNITTPGTLATVASSFLSSITDLTVTGTIDARDFVTMRDNMPLLAIIDLSGATIASYTGIAGTAAASSVVYPANEFPQNAFCNPATNTGKISLTSVVLPTTLTSIGARAFDLCTGITGLTIPTSVTSIGNYAFRNCSGFKSFPMPNSITSIGSGAFYGCNALSAITIPTLVTSIGDNTFSGCSALTAITIPASVTNIGQYAFCNCSMLTNITLPSSLTSIGAAAFYGCFGFTTITIPSNVTSIGYAAFYSCSSLASISLPSSVTSIGDNAFQYCNSLTSIIIPSSVTSIGVSTFQSCIKLTSITLPSSVTTVGESAFNGCTGLTTISIPTLVTSIGKLAFNGCTSLTAFTIPSLVTSIGESAFSGCSSLTAINVPASITSIGVSVFNGCRGLTALTLPNSVTSIGDNAFSNCTGLSNISMPTSLNSIGNSTFSGCGGLTAITLPTSVTSIGRSAFSNCARLTTMTIPGSITSIADNTFSNCGLTAITIPTSITSIGSGAFSMCMGLTAITIPATTTTIGDMAFQSCRALKNLFSYNTTPVALINFNRVFFVSACKHLCTTCSRRIYNIIQRKCCMEYIC